MLIQKTEPFQDQRVQDDELFNKYNVNFQCPKCHTVAFSNLEIQIFFKTI